jgi:cell division initiation protein
MKITPLDVRKQEFGHKMRGYDVDEVRSFLEMVAGEYENVMSKYQEMAKQQSFLEAKLQEYQQMGDTLQDAVLDAQKAGQQAEVDVSKRADLIIQQAELDADKIIHEAKKKHQNLLDDISKLEGQRRSFLLKMKQILRGQVELLEILEQEAPDGKATPGVTGAPIEIS